jgi:hypothetical protein
VIACICGTDLVVVARFRAAARLRLSRGDSPETSGSGEADDDIGSVTVTAKTAYH